ncbi:MAG: hypothetical protein II308_00425, partial [Muribaculaceae bacterium]|nr:hypothetical protein [Muribaculaceae bacterium]
RISTPIGVVHSLYRLTYSYTLSYICVQQTRCTTHFGVVCRWCHLSTGSARLTASLTRGYRSITPSG